MKRLVVGTDGSDGARAATEEALELAGRLGARITFVYVKSAPSVLLADAYYRNRLTEELAHGQEVLDEAERMADAAGAEADYELLEGDAADVILDAAATWAADMVIVGARGQGAVTGAVLGGVSRAVTRHATCPVLVVKREAVPRRLLARTA